MSNLFHISSLKGLTIYYDVTYFYYVLRNKLILVTGDGKLVEKAKQLLETVSTGELVQK
jgi:predicted nucleic acid-binding protein